VGELRFDKLARRLAGACAARRAVVRLLGGTTVAMALAALGRQPAQAACAKVGKRCEKGGERCTGSRCRNGRCRCAAGREACDGSCRELRADSANCGACGVACEASATCSDGICTDPNTDDTNCGACNNVCGAEERCVNAGCVGPGICLGPNDPDQCDIRDGTGSCLCGTTTEGALTCLENSGFCFEPIACAASIDCPRGPVCVDVTAICAGTSDVTPTCLALCPDPAVP
jgi:hypothetical protein